MGVSAGWGGKRAGAGRKKTSGQRSVVIRVNEALVPIVDELKTRFKQGLSLQDLFSVTNNQVNDEASGSFQNKVLQMDNAHLSQENHQLREALEQVQAQLAQSKAVALDLVRERDITQEELRQAEGRYETLKSRFKSLKQNYEELLHIEYDCMAVTSNGRQCTKKAVVDTVLDGMILHVCFQHAKALDKKRR